MERQPDIEISDEELDQFLEMLVKLLFDEWKEEVGLADCSSQEKEG